MCAEIEELESLFSDNFGRTPLCTPACSQDGATSDDDSSGEVNEDDDALVSVDDRAQRYIDAEEPGWIEEHGEDLDDLGAAVLSENDEVTQLRQFKVSGCGSSLQCSDKFSANTIYDNILDTRDLEKPNRELRIMGSINECRSSDSTKRGKKRQRTTYEYTFRSEHVCKKFFMVAFDIKKRALENLLKHLSEHGAVPRTHGNSGKRPAKSLHFEEVKFVVQFISNYAEEFGLPQPAAPRGRDNTPPVYLPSHTTKKNVHAVYRTSSDEANTRTVKYSTFGKIWNACLPHVKIAKPHDDVCGTCERLRKVIMDAVSEEEKLGAVGRMRDHVLLAQRERDVYNECIRQAKETRDLELDQRFIHYTFDFCQNVSLPHHARQMGPLFFTTPRKIQIFGLRLDGIPRQLNFLIDEHETIGRDGGQTHGPNAVISMIDWALNEHGSGEKSCTFHADSCPGQNKNQYVLGYFMWRVMTHRHEKIEYMMQVPGHARCLVDSGFASLKQSFRRTDCDNIDQLTDVVASSSVTNEAVRFPAWTWRDWKSFLAPVFRPVKGIREYQYFKFSADQPGTVVVRKGSDEAETSVNILRTEGYVFDQDLPAVIYPQGLSAERQSYLYRVIRPFVRVASQDQTCPAPDM